MEIYHLRKRSFVDGSEEYLLNPRGFGMTSSTSKKSDKRLSGINGEYREDPFSSCEYAGQPFDADADRYVTWMEYLSDEEREAILLKRKEENERRSIRRTRLNLEALCRANFWRYFATFTFDPEKLDSFDYNACIDAVTNFFIKERRKYPGIKYVLVLEQHKSGRWHCHALIGGCDWFPVMVDSGKRNKNQVIYNLPSEWKLGFTTITTIRKQGACGAYISKYISKDMAVPSGRKRYLSSRNLIKAEDITERISLAGYSFYEVLGNLMAITDTVKEVFVPALDCYVYYFKLYGNREALCS